MTDRKIEQIISTIEARITPILAEVDEIATKNTEKVLQAFQAHKVSDSHFTPSTGYGYDDIGRDTLEKLYASVFNAEAGLVRTQIISGTHAISTCLYGLLRPGDELLYITGKPYDTLEEIVGIRGNGIGSLKEFNISFGTVPLKDNHVDFTAITQAIKPETKVIGIQRSRGYENRPSFTIAEIAEMIRFVKSVRADLQVFVDNCYGEFAETLEPTDVGADLMAGSLIKNPGGGLAKTGGYIVGKKELVEKCAYRLTTPGIGAEAGASLYSLLEMYQGFFLAPHVVAEAIKGAIFSSALLGELGFDTHPKWDDKRTDIVQAVSFNDREKMIRFCQQIQFASPINSHVTPYPAYMPGYEDNVIMAAGTFIQGASIELTADGPLRSPFTTYVQGGLTYSHVKIAVTKAVQAILQEEPIC